MKRFVGIAAGLAALSFTASAASAQEWIPLQDGKSFAGWKAAERPESWVVEEGAFVSRGDRSHLFYTGKAGGRNKPGEFRNFELSLDVMTSPGANSGIYVHTRWQGPGWPEAGYELQVINSNPPAESMNGYVEHKMTGSIYAVRNTWTAPAKDGEWFNYRIRVVDKTLQTFINGKLVCEYAEPTDAYRPDDKKLRRLGSGTFALQAHHPGRIVKYRDIKVRILPDDAPPRAGLVAIADRELDQLITQASNDNIPLIDLDLAPADGVDEKAFWSDARRYGITPFRMANLPPIPSNVAVFNDRERSPPVDVLARLKQQGSRVAFLSAAQGFDETQIKRRLKAIRDAGLDWKDFWVPGKP